MAGRERPGKGHGQFSFGIELPEQDAGGDRLRLGRVPVHAEVGGRLLEMPQEVGAPERDDDGRLPGPDPLLDESDVLWLEVDGPLPRPEPGEQSEDGDVRIQRTCQIDRERIPARIPVRIKNPGARAPLRDFGRERPARVIIARIAAQREYGQLQIGSERQDRPLVLDQSRGALEGLPSPVERRLECDDPRQGSDVDEAVFEQAEPEF